jgi:hypothetical protein
VAAGSRAMDDQFHDGDLDGKRIRRLQRCEATSISFKHLKTYENRTHLEWPRSLLLGSKKASVSGILRKHSKSS